MNSGEKRNRKGEPGPEAKGPEDGFGPRARSAERAFFHKNYTCIPAVLGIFVKFMVP